MAPSKRLTATGKGLLRSGLVAREGVGGVGNYGRGEVPMVRFPPLEEAKELDMLPILAINMASNYWKTRLDSIDTLMSVAEKIGKNLPTSGKFLMVLQLLIKGLTDTNTKVALKAMGALEKFIPMFKTGIEQNAQSLLTGLSTALCSANAALKNKADLLIDLLIDTVETVHLAQPLVHIILYGNSRARPVMLVHLCGNCLSNSRNTAGDKQAEAGTDQRMHIPDGNKTAGRD